MFALSRRPGPIRESLEEWVQVHPQGGANPGRQRARPVRFIFVLLGSASA